MNCSGSQQMNPDKHPLLALADRLNRNTETQIRLRAHMAAENRRMMLIIMLEPSPLHLNVGPATIGEVSVSHEPGIDTSRYNVDISDTAADFCASQLQSDSLSPLPSQLPSESQLQGTQMERHLDKMYKAHIQAYPPSAEARLTEPKASNETFTPSKFLESHDATDVDQAMHKGCSSVFGDPAFDVTPMQDSISEPVYDYTPMQPDDQVYAGDEEDNAGNMKGGSANDTIGRRITRRPARFLSPFKIGSSRNPKCNDSALNLRAFLISPDCELRLTAVLQYGGLTHNARDIAESFENSTFTDNFIIDAFITCLCDDDSRIRQDCFGYRVFTKVDVAMIMNQEEASKGKDVFRTEALDSALRRSLPPSDLMKDTKLIFIPMWHRFHWTVYVINLIHARIDILDSSDYGGSLGNTKWSDHHESMESTQGDPRPWNKIMIERLNDSFHRVCLRGTLPVFTHWRALPIGGLPKQEPNDCAFQVVRFMEFYNGEDGVLTCPLEQVTSEELRAEILHYLVFHPCNEVSKLPDILEQFRTTPTLAMDD
ncbi:hypothetical protein ACP4OV_014074 [Aristida adscensionis]